MAGSSQSVSALELATQIESGQRDATELAQATLRAMADSDSELRAFAARLEPEQALAQLQTLKGPLQGLAVAVKDIFDTVDLPTRYGSEIYGPVPSRHDAVMVSALRQAGALVIGKSTSTEFAYLSPTRTLNPNAMGRTPGGSSAGSAAAVAAGLVPLAIGTQTAGSIIRPASYCGVTGFKPTFGLLPTGGIKCFSWSLDTVGLFAASVRDVAWFAEVVSGYRLALDTEPSSASHPSSQDAANSRPPVVGLPEAYPWGDVSASARKAMDAAVSALRSSGAEVRTVKLPEWMKDVFDAHATIQGYEASRSLAYERDHHANALSDVLRSYLDAVRQTTAAQYESAQLTASAARAEFVRWMGDMDVLLTPSAPDEAPEGYASTGASTFNRAWTLLGVPCVNVTGAVGVNGFPMGLQIIGKQHQDRECLRAASWLERAIGQAAV